MRTKALFETGLILKGLDAVLEIVGGVILLFPATVDKTATALLHHELLVAVRHPHAAMLEHRAVLALQSATVASAAYLVAHGTAKVILIVAVFKDKRWGYQGLMGVLSVFAVVELARCFAEGSWAMFALALLDLLIVWLIVREFRIRFGAPKSTQDPQAQPQPNSEAE